MDSLLDRDVILNNLLDRVDGLERRVALLERFGVLTQLSSYYSITFLADSVDSTSWDGDPYSTTAKTLIDLSAVFGVPAGARAILALVSVRDSGSSGAECALILGPTADADKGVYIDCSGLADDSWERNMVIVPCNSDGDIYYQAIASGAGTLDVYINIWGWWEKS